MSAARSGPTMAVLEDLRDEWAARWPDALALWSPFTRLRPPRFCLTTEDEAREGLTGSFAMIRLVDQTVVVSIRQVAELLGDFPLEILGHEIGHHILCPADLSDNVRLIARIRRALPTVEHRAPSVANMYADLLINDRLQRSRELDMAGVYEALGTRGAAQDPFWNFYMRLYEILWSRPRGTLTHGTIPPRTEGDAVLGARLVRSFANRWLAGAGRFGALCLPYLLDEEKSEKPQAWMIWQDAIDAGAGGFPNGLTEIDDDELEPPRHPALDPELNDTIGTQPRETIDEEPTALDDAEHGSRGQFREPFEYGQLLAASGLHLDEHEVAVRYYRERSVGHLIPFPTRRTPQATDPLPEGVEPWDVGSPLEEIDWIETAMRSPVIIPGATTVRREWGTSTGGEPAKVPIDLDIYVDSSGSMPDPRHNISYLSLAGAIVCLSALRAGARVQATLWSGTNEFISTPGFVRDEQAILRVLTGFFGMGTAFPIHVARDTYANRPPDARPAHMLVVSDDGVTTMFDNDERGRPGREVMNHAIAAAGGGATMVLNLWNDVGNDPQLVQAQQDGWDIHVVKNWEDLVTFARAFSRRAYEDRGAPVAVSR